MTLPLDWSRGPHIRKRVNVRLAMLEHALALAPAAAAAAYLHSPNVLLLLLATAVAAAATQQVFNLLVKQQGGLPDGRATVSGLVLALLLPVNTVWWAGAVAGSLGMLATGLVEHSKLRLRLNPVVPGMLAATVLGSWLPEPVFYGGQADLLSVEAMPLLLAISGLYLVMRRHINWRTPLVVLIVGGVLSAVLGSEPLPLLSSGTWLLGAFFLAADWRTSPLTPGGKVVSAVIIAVAATLLDSYVLFSGGMVLGILLSNVLAGPINRYTRLRALGFLPRATQ